MAKFLHWSDLHREMSSADFPQPTPDCPAGSVDAILINGDLNAQCRHLSDAILIQEAWQVPVVMVWGNHELYRSCYQDLREDEAFRLRDIAADGYDIRVLHCGETTIGDTRILGATLWTDFDILGQRDAMMFGAKHMMRDYSRTSWREPDGSLRRMDPQDTQEMHQTQKGWLLQALAVPHDGPTLVMTHHIPAPELLAVRSGKGELAPGYCSDLRADILPLKIDAWISGHSHWARRGIIEGQHGPIAFSANMMGYDDQTPNFEPYRVLDMDCPTLGLEPIGIEAPELRHLPAAAIFRDTGTPSP